MVTAAQLNCELANTRPPSPPRDPATSTAWHLKNGLALPDHLQTESGSTPQGAGPITKNTPTEHTGTPQMDPQALPAPYTNVSMGVTKDILD
jgi:hypothetical protein